MTSIPTTSDLTELGANIAEHGFADHETRVTQIVTLARKAGCDQPSLDELENCDAPRPVRERALSSLTSRWYRIHDELTQAHDHWGRSFSQLLETWNDHQDLRRSDASLAERWASHQAVDAARRDVIRHPSPLAG
ncbi:MAG: hypothetical protein AAF467_08845 [Actinomycetota bacterium]